MDTSITLLVILNLLGCSCWLMHMEGKTHIVKLSVLPPTLFFMLYVVTSGCFFWIDRFNFDHVLLTTLGAEVLGGAYLRFVKRNRRREINWDLKPYAMLLALVLAAVCMSWQSFGYFGMGQDQGVYQTKAIDLMMGNTSREYLIEEYDLLETDEQRGNYFKHICNLAGLDNMKLTEAELLALPRLIDADVQLSENDAAGIYHGIPTLPAVLGLWGNMLGMEHMGSVNALFFALSIAFIWFAAEALTDKTAVKTLACSILLFSPEALWVAKSTLTESMLTLIMSVFMYMLVRKENPDKRWYSVSMVLLFAFWHVSIYVMFYMFIVLYCLMYLWTHDKQYIRAGILSALSYIVGYTMMCMVSPRYSIRNTERMWFGPLDAGNIYPVFMLVAVIAILLCAILSRFDLRKAVQRFAGSKAGEWFIRILLMGIAAVVLYQMIKYFLDGHSLNQMVVTSGLYNMVWMTGIIALPITLMVTLLKPGSFLKNEIHFGLAFVFFYAVLLMTALLKPVIDYCYYYGRYLVPYIPVAALTATVVMDRFKKRTVYGVAVASCVMMLPFNYSIMNEPDDTISTYHTLEQAAESINGDNTAVVFATNSLLSSSTSKMLFLPVRALTDADCYFVEEDLSAQIQWLKQRYDAVYLCRADNQDSTLTYEGFQLIARLYDRTYVDDNFSNRPWLMPFPLKLSTNSDVIVSIFKSSDQVFTDLKKMSTQIGTWQNEQLVSSGTSGYLMYGPYINLPEGEYRVVVSGQLLSGEVNDASEFDIVAVGEENVMLEGLDTLADFIGADGKFLIDAQFLTVEDYQNLEVRIFVNEGVVLSIDDIDIIKLDLDI